jgi:hypothetical protein
LLERKVLGREAHYVVPKRYTYADEMHRRNSQAHRRASRNFVARAFPGEVIVFRALERHHGDRRAEHYYGHAAMNWSQAAGRGAKVHWMPGRHLTMMHDANAYGFARALQNCLNRAREQDHR